MLFRSEGGHCIELSHATSVQLLVGHKADNDFWQRCSETDNAAISMQLVLKSEWYFLECMLFVIEFFSGLHWLRVPPKQQYPSQHCKHWWQWQSPVNTWCLQNVCSLGTIRPCMLAVATTSVNLLSSALSLYLTFASYAHELKMMFCQFIECTLP